MTVTGYSGDCGDALTNAQTIAWNANGRKFSAPESDNDSWDGGNCAASYGWWFGSCSGSDINQSENHGQWTTAALVLDLIQSRMLVKLN